MNARTLPNGAGFRYDGLMLVPSSNRHLILLSLVCASAFAVATVSLAGCSSSSGGSSSGTPAEGGSETGTDGGGGGDTSVADTGPTPVNDCKNFVDRSATSASRTITWDFPVSTAPERCMIIKKGQDVTFSGDFATHPLGGSGGDTPNPISAHDAAGKVTFAAAGTFGFQCGNHPSMTGAIQVNE